jgi:hypothetical protein
MQTRKVEALGTTASHAKRYRFTSKAQLSDEIDRMLRWPAARGRAPLRLFAPQTASAVRHASSQQQGNRGHHDDRERRLISPIVGGSRGAISVGARDGKRIQLGEHLRRKRLNAFGDICVCPSSRSGSSAPTGRHRPCQERPGIRRRRRRRPGTRARSNAGLVVPIPHPGQPEGRCPRGTTPPSPPAPRHHRARSWVRAA